ncbi:hypothetical protein EYR38_010809 [Pleurotus pulmonarius]|nr:hypothetical protein EYR38_010809 [Pleurotus pulmonarius]
MGDANVNGPPLLSHQLPSYGLTHRSSNGGGPVNDAGKKILINVPGLVRSEIRAVLAAEDLLVHAEKNATKGKGKENAFDDPLLPSKPLDEKVDLPLGIQVLISLARSPRGMEIGTLTFCRNANFFGTLTKVGLYHEYTAIR